MSDNPIGLAGGRFIATLVCTDKAHSSLNVITAGCNLNATANIRSADPRHPHGEYEFNFMDAAHVHSLKQLQHLRASCVWGEISWPLAKVGARSVSVEDVDRLRWQGHSLHLDHEPLHLHVDFVPHALPSPQPLRDECLPFVLRIIAGSRAAHAALPGTTMLELVLEQVRRVKLTKLVKK